MKSAVLASLILLYVPCHAHGAEEVIHERIEWSDVWVVNANSETRPRVLLIGDSITRGYFAGVEKALGERANCARFTTSKFIGHPDFLTELRLILSRFSFDVIHINNGLHGWGYTEAQYRDGVAKLLRALRDDAPDASVVWCLTTPVRDSDDLSRFDAEKNPRVLERNTIATAVAAEADIPVNDLYQSVAEHPEYFTEDGVHFNEAGRAVQAAQVAGAVAAHLPK